MKKIYEIADGDATLSLEIDTAVLTLELAREINSFWSGAERILERSSGDAYQAVARRAAHPIFVLLSQGSTDEGAVLSLCEDEGWPPAAELGMKITDSYLPSFDAADVSVSVV